MGMPAVIEELGIEEVSCEGDGSGPDTPTPPEPPELLLPLPDVPVSEPGREEGTADAVDELELPPTAAVLPLPEL